MNAATLEVNNKSEQAEFEILIECMGLYPIYQFRLDARAEADILRRTADMAEAIHAGGDEYDRVYAANRHKIDDKFVCFNSAVSQVCNSFKYDLPQSAAALRTMADRIERDSQSTTKPEVTLQHRFEGAVVERALEPSGLGPVDEKTWTMLTLVADHYEDYITKKLEYWTKNAEKTKENLEQARLEIVMIQASAELDIPAEDFVPMVRQFVNNLKEYAKNSKISYFND